MKKHWNYRVIRFTDSNGETYCAIHEVHYENDKAILFTENPAVVLWDSDDKNEPQRILEKMASALNKEILTEADFAKGMK